MSDGQTYNEESDQKAFVRRLPSDGQYARAYRYGIQRTRAGSTVVLVVNLEPRSQLVHIGVDLAGLVQLRANDIQPFSSITPMTFQDWARPILEPILGGRNLPVGAMRRVHKIIMEQQNTFDQTGHILPDNSKSASRANAVQRVVADMSVPIQVSRDWMDRARYRPEQMLHLVDQDGRSLVGFLGNAILKSGEILKNIPRNLADIEYQPVMIAALMVEMDARFSAEEAQHFLEVATGLPSQAPTHALLERRILEGDTQANKESANGTAPTVRPTRSGRLI